MRELELSAQSCLGVLQAMKLTNRGEWCQKLQSEVGFHGESNSSSFAGRRVLVETNATWESNVMVFEFVT